jgi:hypothetical protein
VSKYGTCDMLVFTYFLSQIKIHMVYIGTIKECSQIKTWKPIMKFGDYNREKFVYIAVIIFVFLYWLSVSDRTRYGDKIV